MNKNRSDGEILLEFLDELRDSGALNKNNDYYKLYYDAITLPYGSLPSIKETFTDIPENTLKKRLLDDLYQCGGVNEFTFNHFSKQFQI